MATDEQAVMALNMITAAINGEEDTLIALFQQYANEERDDMYAALAGMGSVLANYAATAT